MSQRSIIEINHDQSMFIKAEPEAFLRELGYALASGSDRSWEALRRFGVRRIIQCHHSDDRKVVVGKGALEREYKIP